MLYDVAWGNRYILLLIVFLGASHVGLHHDELVSKIKSSINKPTLWPTDKVPEFPIVSSLTPTTAFRTTPSLSAISGEELELPGEGQELPGEGQELPGEGQELPGEELELPGEGLELPGEGQELPGEGLELPGEELELPGEELELPGEELELPGEGKELPGEGQELPGEGQELPGEGQELPGEGQELPGEGQELPGEELELPVEGQELPEEEYLAVCVAAKNQQQYLPEFVQHHYYHMNVTHFYIMDDRSDPPVSSSQEYGIPSSALTFTHYTHEDVAALQLPRGHMQLWIYQQCISLWGTRHKWMMFIDTDEFIEVRTQETLEEVLRGLGENVGSLSINWLTHTSGGHLTRQKSVRQSFTVCIVSDLAIDDMSQIDRHVKSIVRPERFNEAMAHIPRLNNNALSVGEDELEVKPGHAWRFPITRDRLVVHHYAVKSREEFQEKLDLWKEDMSPRDWAFWDDLETQQNHTECREMARYSP